MPATNRPRGATAISNRENALSLPSLPQVPRIHLIAGTAVLLCFSIALILSPSDNSTPIEQATDIESLPESSATAPDAPVDTFATEVAAVQERPWIDQTVRSGDNLSLIFKRAGYSKRDVHRVVSESSEGKNLAKIYPGQTITFQADNNGDLLAVRHIESALETTTYTRGDTGFESEITTRTPITQDATATGVITSSLFMAGQNAGLSHNMIMEMANIFGGVIDFVADPRKGDTMHLIYQDLYLDGKKYADGEIIAASFTNQGKTYTAYRYTDAKGDVGYFNEDGVSMRKAFLLAPVDFTRISSNFNLRRLHPIYKTNRPHRGTDYAAPTGTPVFAAGDGRVVKAGYSRANGNYVFIGHGETYVTKYLHLHKRKVKQGQRVSQSQVIGTVGATGAATGPHLHYEFLMNGVHRNPRTIHKKLPKAKSLPAGEIPSYQQAVAAAASQLESLRDNQQLALNNAASDQS